jgi:hypothetical protein
MLHATARRGKSTLYKRYLGHREKGELHVHGEDEITSTVIGPLDFLLPSEVHYFWNNVLKEETNHVMGLAQRKYNGTSYRARCED